MPAPCIQPRQPGLQQLRSASDVAGVVLEFQHLVGQRLAGRRHRLAGGQAVRDDDHATGVACPVAADDAQADLQVGHAVENAHQHIDRGQRGGHAAL
jgi:hypothetical protein